jgi:hypothetical protein
MRKALSVFAGKEPAEERAEVIIQEIINVLGSPLLPEGKQRVMFSRRSPGFPQPQGTETGAETGTETETLSLSLDESEDNTININRPYADASVVPLTRDQFYELPGKDYNFQTYDSLGGESEIISIPEKTWTEFFTNVFGPKFLKSRFLPDTPAGTEENQQ